MYVDVELMDVGVMMLLMMRITCMVANNSWVLALLELVFIFGFLRNPFFLMKYVLDISARLNGFRLNHE